MQANITNEDILKVPLRIHIAPVGFEIDRIVLPVKMMKAEKVILIENDSVIDQGGKFYTEVKKELAKVNIEVEVERRSIFNLESNMNLFTDLINRYKDNQISINISSGSKIQALAAFISAMSAKSQGILVTTYYIEPDQYTDNPPREPISKGCKNIIPLPIFPLYTPSNEIRGAMQLLKNRSYSKLELAIELSKRGIFTETFLDSSRTHPRDDKARMSLQNLVENKVIEPMIRDKYATTERVGRKIKVTLTRLGEEATHLFMTGSSHQNLK